MKHKKLLFITIIVLFLSNFFTGSALGEEIDNCPGICNIQQLDADGDDIGDVCDETPGCGGCGQPACEISCDLDNDGILNPEDNCPDICNKQQLDADSDDIGDVCDNTPGCGGCGQPACEQEGCLQNYNTIENLVPYSEAFDQHLWNRTNITVTDMGDYQKLEQNPANQTFLQAQRIPLTSEKFISVIIRCKPTAIEGQFTELLAWDTGTTGGKSFRLPLDRFSTIKLKTTTLTKSDILLNIRNPLNLENFGLYIEKVHVFESIAPVLYNNGDSIALTPVENHNVFYCNSYADLYADTYNIEFEQKAVGGERLDQIRPRVQSDLAGATYPIVFLDGGTNDILQASTNPVTHMLNELELMITAAKAASDTIVLFTAPSCPVYNTLKLSWANSYNAGLKSRYENDSSVTILDMDTILGAEDYDVNDNIHPTIDAHVKIFNAIDAAISFPLDVARYGYVKTEGSGILNAKPKAMIIGDSQGQTSGYEENSWRCKLQEQMNYSHNFVGGWNTLEGIDTTTMGPDSSLGHRGYLVTTECDTAHYSWDRKLASYNYAPNSVLEYVESVDGVGSFFATPTEKDFIILIVGTNDVLFTYNPDLQRDAINNGIGRFVEYVHEHDENINVLIVSIYPNQEKEEIVREMNSLLSAYVTTKDTLHFVDVNTPLSENWNIGEYTYDGIHANANGMAVIAETIYNKLFTLGLVD